MNESTLDKPSVDAAENWSKNGRAVRQSSPEPRLAMGTSTWGESLKEQTNKHTLKHKDDHASVKQMNAEGSKQVWK